MNNLIAILILTHAIAFWMGIIIQHYNYLALAQDNKNLKKVNDFVFKKLEQCQDSLIDLQEKSSKLVVVIKSKKNNYAK